MARPRIKARQISNLRANLANKINSTLVVRAISGNGIEYIRFKLFLIYNITIWAWPWPYKLLENYDNNDIIWP